MISLLQNKQLCKHLLITDYAFFLNQKPHLICTFFHSHNDENT